MAEVNSNYPVKACPPGTRSGFDINGRPFQCEGVTLSADEVSAIENRVAMQQQAASNTKTVTNPLSFKDILAWAIVLAVIASLIYFAIRIYKR